MLYGNKVILRTVRSQELDYVYEKITNVNEKGPYWHLVLPSYNEFIKEYNSTGFWSNQEGRMLILNREETIIGEILYFKGLDYQSGYEIGYELFSPEYSGSGYMSEALLLFCAYMFSIRPINRVQVNVMEGNIASQRVVEKCGFTYEGMMRKATFHKGTYHNLKLYSLLREECPPLETLLKSPS
jgi:ribosomal-protein-alanine N-acetyltransferase